MDLPAFVDAYASASYITSYLRKGSRAMSELLRKACQEADSGNVHLKQQVRTIGNTILNNVDIAVQETVRL